MNDKETVDSTLPWGVYIPPKLDNERCNRHGYVCILDRKGKSFQCGFSRPAKHTDAEVSTGSKRRRDEISRDGDQVNGDIHNTSDASRIEQDASELINKSNTEECLHPEEALFLHTRGLLRIESLPVDEIISNEPRPNATMFTQELVNTMLPECKVPYTAYLAYAHLREQGYILMRYTTNRIELLCKIDSAAVVKKPLRAIGKDNANDATHEANVNNNYLSEKKYNKQQFKDNVMNAPPPCVICCDNVPNVEDGDAANVCLSYFAYNPNAQFKRTNPGMPDFGVAIMPFHSHGDRGPTVDVISSLLSLCQVQSESTAQSIDFPLRVMTVSDGGAVIAFGVTDGDVPSINR
jgi:hypothetical protein